MFYRTVLLIFMSLTNTLYGSCFCFDSSSSAEEDYTPQSYWNTQRHNSSSRNLRTRNARIAQRQTEERKRA